MRYYVAPFVGAWIEICFNCCLYSSSSVAPFVGAWIEIRTMTTTISKLAVSLRSSERGLKSDGVYTPEHVDAVAPFVGAWIEIE